MAVLCDSAQRKIGLDLPGDQKPEIYVLRRQENNKI